MPRKPDSCAVAASSKRMALRVAVHQRLSVYGRLTGHQLTQLARPAPVFRAAANFRCAVSVPRYAKVLLATAEKAVLLT